LELVEKAHLAPVEVIDGRFFALGNVMEETQSLEVMLWNQISHVVFNIIQCYRNPVVLGLSLFELYYSNVDWNLLRISSKS
jgi:hypothetical protein